MHPDLSVEPRYWVYIACFRLYMEHPLMQDTVDWGVRLGMGISVKIMLSIHIIPGFRFHER